MFESVPSRIPCRRKNFEKKKTFPIADSHLRNMMVKFGAKSGENGEQNAKPINIAPTSLGQYGNDANSNWAAVPPGRILPSTFPKPYLRGVPGKMSPEKQLEFGLYLLGLRALFIRETGKIPRALTYQSIANKVGVCHFNFNFNSLKNIESIRKIFPLFFQIYI